MLRRLCGGDQLIQIQSKDTACNNSNINNSNDNYNSNEQQHSVDRKADLSSGHNAVLTVSHKAHLTNSRTSSDATPQQTSSRKHLPKTNPMDSAMTQISQPQSQFIVKTRIRTKLTNNDKNNKDINSNNTNNSNNNSNSKTNDSVSSSARSMRRERPEYTSIPTTTPPRLPIRLHPVSADLKNNIVFHLLYRLKHTFITSILIENNCT